MSLTEFGNKCHELYEKAFTPEFKNNELILDVLFDSLDKDDLEYYESGEILSFVVEPTEETNKIIQNYDAYRELTDLRFDTSATDGKIDLITAIEYLEDIAKDYIRFDRDNEEFYYLTDED